MPERAGQLRIRVLMVLGREELGGTKGALRFTGGKGLVS